jgi:hypothetical protein
MQSIGATHATIHKLVHSQGSVDPTPHITATFKGPVQGPHGGTTLEPIPSTWNHNGTPMTGTRHHVPISAAHVQQHMPEYHAALQRKQGLQPHQSPTLRRRALRRRALLRDAYYV